MTDREKDILCARFGMNEEGKMQTFQDVGRQIGLSKETCPRDYTSDNSKNYRIWSPRKRLEWPEITL